MTLRAVGSSSLSASPFVSLHSSKGLLFAAMSWGQSQASSSQENQEFPEEEKPFYSPDETTFFSPVESLYSSVSSQSQSPNIQMDHLFKKPCEPNPRKRSLVEEEKEKRLIERFPNVTQALLKPNLIPAVYMPDRYPSYKWEQAYYQRHGNKIKRESPVTYSPSFYQQPFIQPSYHPSFYSFQEPFMLQYHPQWEQPDIPIDVLLSDAPLPPSPQPATSQDNPFFDVKL